jgi:hypothetical protein
LSWTEEPTFSSQFFEGYGQVAATRKAAIFLKIFKPLIFKRGRRCSEESMAVKYLRWESGFRQSSYDIST